MGDSTFRLKPSNERAHSNPPIAGVTDIASPTLPGNCRLRLLLVRLQPPSDRGFVRGISLHTLSLYMLFRDSVPANVLPAECIAILYISLMVYVTSLL